MTPIAAGAGGRREHAHRDLTPLVDYRVIAKLFHWATAALVFLQIALGVAMTQIGTGAVADFLFSLHKLNGAGVLTLALARWLYRLVSRMSGQWRRMSGHHRVHRLLYGFLLATPLLGLAGVSDFGARDAFGFVLPAIWPEGAGWSDALLRLHAWFAFALLALVCIHIGVALQDYIMRRSDVEPAAHRP